MSYRFLIVNADYCHFLEDMYRRNPGLSTESFDEQHSARMQTLFGMNDFYSVNLRKLGHQAIDLTYNNRFMQYAWACENDLVKTRTENISEIAAMPPQDLAHIFIDQIKKFKPDVIVNLAMETVTSRILNAVKPQVKLIIGQHAAAITPSMNDLSAYDLTISSLPNVVDYFRNQNKESFYFKLGFEADVLDQVPTDGQRDIDIGFVGGFSGIHTIGREIFNYLAEQGFVMELFGYDEQDLSAGAKNFFRGAVYGRDMYDVYARSKIVINKHVPVVAGEYANNMRLYEATGMGALLITDFKKNLGEIFDIGDEVIAYHSEKECADLVRYYLKHPEERDRIAKKGQERILSEHTYYHRMVDLVCIINGYFNKHNNWVKVIESQANRSKSQSDQEPSDPSKAVTDACYAVEPVTTVEVGNKKILKTTNALKTPLVLLYHRVANDPIDSQLLAVSPDNFDDHLRELANNYKVIPLSKLLEQTQQGHFEPDTVALTFDDGYADNLINALPLLEKYNLPATIFVTSGMVGLDREFWWDEMERIFLTGHPLPDVLSINDSQNNLKWDTTTDQGRFMAYEQLCGIFRDKKVEEVNQIVDMLVVWAGMPLVGRDTHLVLNQKQLKILSSSPLIEIGSHTFSHTRLSILQVKEQLYEMIMSKQSLEKMINKPVNLFSYPYGTADDFTTQTAQFVEEAGYIAGIANIQSEIVMPYDAYAVPRRLVRNWPGQIFAEWLTAENKGILEAQTVSKREQKILNCLLGYKSSQSISATTS